MISSVEGFAALCALMLLFSTVCQPVIRQASPACKILGAQIARFLVCHLKLATLLLGLEMRTGEESKRMIEKNHLHTFPFSDWHLFTFQFTEVIAIAMKIGNETLSESYFLSMSFIMYIVQQVRCSKSLCTTLSSSKMFAIWVRVVI